MDGRKLLIVTSVKGHLGLNKIKNSQIKDSFGKKATPTTDTFVSNRPTRTGRIVRPEQSGNHNPESSDEDEIAKETTSQVSIPSPEPCSSSSEREKTQL